MISPPSGVPKTSSTDWSKATRDLGKPTTLKPEPERFTLTMALAHGKRIAEEEALKKERANTEAEVVASQETDEGTDQGPQHRAKKGLKKPTLTDKAKQKVKDFFSR